MELMTRFAKQGGVVHAEDGLASMGTRVQDQFGSGQAASPTDKAPVKLSGTGGDNGAMMLRSFQPMAVLQLKDGGELHAEGGFFGGLRNYITGQTAATTRRMAAAEAPRPQPSTQTPPPPPPPPVDPRVTATNPAGIQFKHGGELRNGGEIHAQWGFPDSGIFGPGNALGEGGAVDEFMSSEGPLDRFHKSIQAQPLQQSVMNRGNFPGQGIPTGTQLGAPYRAPLPATGAGAGRAAQSGFGPAVDAAGGGRGTINNYGPQTPQPMGMPNHTNLRTSETPQATGFDRAGFLARNPNIAAQQPAPTPAAPAPAPNGIKYSANQFGDAAAQKEWATPGRSTGRPDAQTMAVADGFAQRDAVKARAAQTGMNFGPPAQTSMAPYSGPVSGLPGAPGSFKVNTAGMKHGGTLRTGHGGDVPGTGHGDKIPAKYEPGEFVVSNDMLDAKPSLRGELRALRKTVLAKKGMTPEMADAKALGGKSLRAVDGVIIGDAAGNNKLPTYQVPAVINNAPAQPPINPGARDPYRYLGQRAGEFVRSPTTQLAGRAAGAVGAGYQAHQALNDVDSGNYAGVIEHGIRGAVAAAPLNPASIGAMAAIGAGDYAYSKMGDSTKDAIGRTINSGVRQLGGVMGQDWGVDDTAMRQSQGNPLTHGVNAGAPKPQLREPQNFDAANTAMLAKSNAESPTGPAKLNDTRNIDNEAGTMEVFTKANSDKAGWTTVSTPAAKEKRLRDAEDYKAELAAGAATSRADTARQLAYFQQANGGGDKYANMPIKMAMAARSADVAAAAQLQANAETNRTSRENTRDTNETTLMGNRMTNAFGLRKFNIEQGWKEREFSAGRQDKAAEQRISHDKAWNDHATTLFQTDDGNGKMVPDAKRIAAYTQATDATVNAMAKQLLASSNPEEVTYGKKLLAQGKAALDDRDRAAMTKHFQRMELHRDSYGINPLAGSGGPTNDLRAYSDANMRPQKGNLIQQRMEFIDPNTGQPIGAIPNVNLQYGPNANHVLPNFGAPNNSLR
jgi:hypothetical protein